MLILYRERDLDEAYRIDCKARTKGDEPWIRREDFRNIYEALLDTYSFKEGDKVILDGQVAMIIKIGFTQTVFGVYSDDGYTWRYIPNQKIDSIKLEKVVDQDLHADSAMEKAEKLRKILEAKDV